MRKLIYSMNASLDGYVAAHGDDISWGVPSGELHQWFNDRAREIAVSLYGRKLWQVMSAHWPTADQQPDATPVEVEFARIWNAKPKIVAVSTRNPCAPPVQEEGRLRTAKTKMNCAAIVVSAR